MTTEELRAAVLDEFDAFRARVDKLFAPPAPADVVVPAGGDVFAALNSGKPVHLVAGAEYPALTLPSGARLFGHGATIRGTGKPAIYVAPGTTSVQVEDVICTASEWNGAVVQLGDNDVNTQPNIDRVPQGILLDRVRIPTHRGKRGFEINAAFVALQNCEARDIYTTTGQDSSALGILNTNGHVTVTGGVYEGGSECVLIGGDSLKLADVTAPADLLFDGCLMTRPVSWKTDGVKRVVKNLFELKTGHKVIVRNCTLEHCWKDGQDGYAVMLTPTRGGSLVDVLFEHCTVRDVGGGVNITGIHPDFPNAPRTTGVVFRDCGFSISKAQNGGTGRFMLLTNGPETIEVERCLMRHDGNAVVYQSGPVVGKLLVVDSEFQAGSYGFNLGGTANAAKWRLGVLELEVAGNRISGAAPALRVNLPDNVYV